MEKKRSRARNWHKVKYWGNHINGWVRSGLTQKGYCLRHKLNFHTFHTWRRKLGKAPEKGLRLVSLDDQGEVGRQSTDAAIENRQIRIQVNHLTLEVDEAIEPRVLKEIVEVMVSSCGV